MPEQTSPVEIIEKRRFLRLNDYFRVTFRSLDRQVSPTGPAPEGVGFSKNVSLGGVCFVADGPCAARRATARARGDPRNRRRDLGRRRSRALRRAEAGLATSSRSAPVRRGPTSARATSSSCSSTSTSCRPKDRVCQRGGMRPPAEGAALHHGVHGDHGEVLSMKPLLRVTPCFSVPLRGERRLWWVAAHLSRRAPKPESLSYPKRIFASRKRSQKSTAAIEAAPILCCMRSLSTFGIPIRYTCTVGLS